MIRLQNLINFSFLLDSGDKSVQCGRKTDAFKIWFMLKVRGEDFISKRVDNAFEQAKLMETMIKKREGFRMVLEQSCTNVCFQYIPPSLRNQEEDKEWETKIDKVNSKIKVWHYVIYKCY